MGAERISGPEAAAARMMPPQRYELTFSEATRMRNDDHVHGHSAGNHLRLPIV